MHDFHVNKTFSLIDTSFQPDYDDKHFLSIEISLGRITYCILDSRHFKYRVMESYDIEDLFQWEDCYSVIEKIIRNNFYLQFDFQRVSLIYVSPQSVFIPSGLYLDDKKDRYLSFNHIFDNNEYKVSSEKLYNLDAYAIYPFPRLLNANIEKFFPDYRIRHFSTTLIESVLYDIRHGGYKTDLVIHLQKEHFEIIIVDKNGELLFFNSFMYQTWDDILYYVFFVIENIGLSAESIDVLMIGETSMDSELYKNLGLYFRYIDFGSRSDMYKYDDVFDNIPHHYFYNLLNSHACG